jgi:small subunit ribosomal protein S16
MLMIRLARYGAKKRPFYHFVAIDRRRARDGICKEKLGFYNPIEKYAQINLERVKYWLSTGAQCSETAEHLIKMYEKGELQSLKKPARKTPAQSVDQATEDLKQKPEKKTASGKPHTKKTTAKASRSSKEKEVAADPASNPPAAKDAGDSDPEKNKA